MEMEKDISRQQGRSSVEWFAYFRSNPCLLDRIDQGSTRGLIDGEKRRITGSIREFQLGESSEGRNLSQFAREYSQRIADPFYYESIKLFIREEQKHAQALGRFMDREGIARAKSSFVDSVFRQLRRYAGLEVSITVLLMAEIISLVYYRSLWAATGSPWLKRICRELLRDERAHLEFHCQRLALIRQGRWKAGLLGVHLTQAMLLTGTCVAVWFNHWEVLKVRHSPLSFWRFVWRVYGSAIRKMKSVNVPLGVEVVGKSFISVQE